MEIEKIERLIRRYARWYDSVGTPEVAEKLHALKVMKAKSLREFSFNK